MPATIAVLEGVPHVGLNEEQLEMIARGGASVRKASRRDLPDVIAHRLTGATTVSATMLLAARAGIAVFVTGGERSVAAQRVATGAEMLCVLRHEGMFLRERGYLTPSRDLECHS